MKQKFRKSMMLRETGFTLIELFVVVVILVIAVAVITPKVMKQINSQASPTGAISYPSLPTGSTPGSAAAAWISQGEFTDSHTIHKRLETLEYKFNRYEYNYTQVPDRRAKAGVVFHVKISVVNAGDNPAITGVSNTTGSSITNRTTAVIVSDQDGDVVFDIEMPAGEFSDHNTLKIVIEEVDAAGGVIRRILHDDVTITPF